MLLREFDPNTCQMKLNDGPLKLKFLTVDHDLHV